LARSTRDLGASSFGSRSMENSLQGCCFSNSGGKSSSARRKTKGATPHSLVKMYELPNFDPSSAIRISDNSGPEAAACREMILKFLQQ
jgi:hypothetical protein